MRVLAIDFSLGSEDLSTRPNRYGGGQVVFSWCRELMNDFTCVGTHESFENLGNDEKTDKCLVLSRLDIETLTKNVPLSQYINENNYDLVFHSSPHIFVNTNLPQISWAPGYAEAVDYRHQFILNHSPAFQLTQLHDHQRLIKVQIGKPVPAFQEYNKEDCIFQCSNHTPAFQSSRVAELCKKNKIKAYFAGPISENYDLLKYIDNINTFYYGIMKYNDKIDLTKRARIHTLLHAIPINFTLSGLEALAYGCSLITTPAGFWPTFINEKIGRLVNNEEDFLKAFESSRSINQYDCWLKAKEYDNFKMVQSFNAAFYKILGLA